MKHALACDGFISMATSSTDATDSLIEIARATLRDLRQQDVDKLQLTLDSTLDHDLGLDSLARVELFARIEQELRIHLPDSLFDTAETLRDIATALTGATRPGTLARSAPAPLSKPIAAAPPASIVTLDQVLRWHQVRHPEFVQITVCGDSGDDRITYEQLWRDASELAGGLQHHGIGPGATVALMLPTSRDYFGAFLGVLLAGAVPVPLYPPARLSQIEEHVRRHAGILANAECATLITTVEMRRLGALLRAHAPSLRVITTAAELRSQRAQPRYVPLSEGSTALLQYTSGSTGQPKGVVLSHANILTNISSLGRALDIRVQDVFVSWLPLYHDMGLIGAWLGTFYFGLPLVVMSPLTFLNRPLRWLETIHRYRGTLSAAPNFAYELCLKRVSDDEVASLDLSTWRIAMNGAEAVMPDTIARFQERFRRCGLPRTSLTPVYGLAECSVGLTIPPLDRGPLVDAIERDSLVRYGVATPARQDSTSTLRFVSCGLPIAGHQVRIVDDAGHEVPERREGRLTFRGPSTTQGYYRNPEQTKHLIREGWLDSGDRAYAANGEIYVTGRIKDIIIRAGRHIYPDEVEAAVGGIAGIRKGCVAVFGSTDAASGTERVIVLAETRVDDPVHRESLRQEIITAVVQLTGEPPDEVVLAAPHTVLKTSSGKIRRAASREVYESRSYRDRRRRSAGMQVMRLGLGALSPAAKRLARRLLDVLYGMYFWILFTVLGTIAFLVVLLPLNSQAVWSVMRTAVRLFLRGVGIRLVVQGDEPTRIGSRRLVVANHSSYLDGLFLVAALPRPHRFVAKRELANAPIVALLLRRLGTVFVERFDARAGVEDANRVAKLAQQGESFIFFPEGTFTRAPGLLPFHLGAFTASVAADRPIVPIALRGTRALLRDGQWLPRRVPVIVYIGQPVAAIQTRNAFSNIVQRRETARRFILERCGEPDLAGLPAHEPADVIASSPVRASD